MKYSLKIASIAAGSLMLPMASAYACGIEGAISSSSNSYGSGQISTSWSSKTAVPHKGVYQLYLGGKACGARVTVYINGEQGKTIKLPSRGYGRANFVQR